MAVDQTSNGFSFAMLSSVGRVRSGNEDFCAAAPEQGLFIVCDGMGGAAAGEIASELAATTFLAQMQTAFSLPGTPGHRLDTTRHRLDTTRHHSDTTRHHLGMAAQASNTAVHERAAASPSMRGMGTTLVALLLEAKAMSGARKLWLTHVGDSRCYRLRAGSLTQRTLDHSLVQEQINAGQLTPEQAERSPMRNIITRAIGSGPQVEAEVQELEAERGDIYLLASDGLTRELADDQLAMQLQSSTGALDTVCQSLIDAANEAGGHDNITVLVLRIDA